MINEALKDMVENLIHIKGEEAAKRYAVLLRNLAYHKHSIAALASRLDGDQRKEFLQNVTSEIAMLTGVLTYYIFGPEEAEEALSVLRRLEERL